jgi:tRNA(adenine34) deaminase
VLFRSILATDPTGHAEINALRDAAARQGNYRLPGATLYVTIEPCTMCFGALIHARIARLVYGAAEPRAGVCESRLNLPEQRFYNHRIEVIGGIEAVAAADLMRRFFRTRRAAPDSAP